MATFFFLGEDASRDYSVWAAALGALLPQRGHGGRRRKRLLGDSQATVAVRRQSILKLQVGPYERTVAIKCSTAA